MATDCSTMALIDEEYEFSAPMFFDFINPESEEDVKKSELWFQQADSHAPSPMMPKIKMKRSVHFESLCDFSESEQLECSKKSVIALELGEDERETQQEEKVISETTEVGLNNVKEEQDPVKSSRKENLEEKTSENHSEESRIPNEVVAGVVESIDGGVAEAQTPIPTIPQKVEVKKTTDNTKRRNSAKKIASLLRNPSALIKRETLLHQENQAIKKQKLEGGRSREFLDLKQQIFPHKSKLGLHSNRPLTCSSNNTQVLKENRKIYVREQESVPFVSMAEMMKKFESGTRCGSVSNSYKGKLTLTRPKEPELETAQRLRPVKIKSSAELEEEMMAKIPKFKARPVNKKILEASTLPRLQRSIPQLPEFQEFHLETMERGNQNIETSTVASVDSSLQILPFKARLTTPKSPKLETLLRARPRKIKSSTEMEKEELLRIPKFKARPLDRKILESKGDLGMYCNQKKQITIPQEFHFATDDRVLPLSSSVFSMFDKLLISSDLNREKQVPPKKTNPNPFHLQTEERGAEKQKKFIMEMTRKQLEEEWSRNPKANPYPYSTDYPVIPAKPDPKPCTKLEPFQLASLVRHEEEVLKEVGERKRMEKMEAELKIFKAQPVMKEDPMLVAEKTRMPLTEVQEFTLHANTRALQRSDFDKMIKEKEVIYKRQREQAEHDKQMEEEREVKQLRKTMVTHPRSIPSFDHPFIPTRSKKNATKPMSPKLRVNGRVERQRVGHQIR